MEQQVDEVSGTTQRTVVQKSVTSTSSSASKSYNAGYSAGYNTDYRMSSKSVPSSYQLRFGNRSSRSMGYSSYGGSSPYRSPYKSVETTVSRVTVGDGLELTPNLISTRAEEKAALGGLNDRFVTYIDKVRSLVVQNKTLAAKVEQLEASRTTTSRAGDLYEEQLHKLQAAIDKVLLEKTQLEIDLESCLRDLDDLKKRLDREIEDRVEAENEARSLRKDVDMATLSRVELESKVETLREELELIRRSADEDICVLTAQIEAMGSVGGDVIVDGSTTDLSESLRDIRGAYEKLTQNNKVEVEQFYKVKIGELNAQLKEENNNQKASKNEINEARRQIQTITVEIEGLRSSNSALESQLEEVEGCYAKDLDNCHQKIEVLEEELGVSRDRAARQLVDYNELLNLKLSLDLEIQTYRKLLDGEEDRINAHSFSSGSYDHRDANDFGGITVVEKKVVTVQTKTITKEESSSSSSSSSSSESESEI